MTERMLTELLVSSGVMGADAAADLISRSFAKLAVGAATDATAHIPNSVGASVLPSHGEQTLLTPAIRSSSRTLKSKQKLT